MAIYTQYGRYLKAKMFKNELDALGDTYMVLGMGNPFWDDASSGQKIPVSPYNTDDILVTNPAGQFTDVNARQRFITNNDVITTLNNTGVVDNTYLKKVKSMLPPFPCVWEDYTNNNVADNKDLVKFTLSDGGSTPIEFTIKQNNYYKYYITANNALYSIDDSSAAIGTITSVSSLNDLGSQCFSELKLRGEALNIKSGENNPLSSLPKVKAPVGLLGALKCNISFVRDIGSTSEVYTGEPNQFWYGDRYWETVDESELEIDKYISSDIKYFPHHLLISSTVNPRVLHPDLSIDKNLRARQIALFVRKRNNDVGQAAYRVKDYIFNFGQYSKEDFAQLQQDTIANKVLDFTLKCKFSYHDESADEDVVKTYDGGEFSFILNDYIKGTTRTNHSTDRFGYVIGF